MQQAINWRHELRDARRKLGVSQRTLAERAGLSESAVRAYEAGKRFPHRQHLSKLIDSLSVDRAWRNRLLLAAGFAPDGLQQRPADIEEWWPAFVLSERAEVLAANAAAEALWNVDLEREFLGPLDRNLLSVASNPRFADRVVNWDEAVGTIVWMFKAFHREQEQIDEPSPYFAAALEHFMKGDPKYVGKLVDLWQSAPETPMARIRWTYPVEWDEPGFGRMRFRCLVSTANENDGLALNDWIPVGAESWAVLERIKAARVSGGVTNGVPRPS